MIATKPLTIFGEADERTLAQIQNCLKHDRAVEGALKRLDEVLLQHANVEVLHRLSPIGVVMAGDDTFDPYKD